jgi:hypothetical protein
VFIEAGGAPPARKMKNRAGPVVERRAGLRIGDGARTAFEKNLAGN